jgi:hypothetical protein
VLRLPDAWPLVFSALGVACGGTVDPGENFQFAQVVYDQNYFYCKVEPMLIEQSCGPGKSGTDAPNGCHENVTPFRLTPHASVPIACNGLVPTTRIPAEAQSNYEAAAREMSAEPDRAPLLNRPTRRAAHPRQIFDAKSAQADVIRQWATKYTSQ